MPLQNRVTPFGTIVSQTARGMFTGNRGVVHDPETRTLLPTRRWTTKAWIICRCDYKGRKRDVFGMNGPNGGPGWTNLFFLDEATAFSAGHRPCYFCQRQRALDFQDAFSKGQGVHKMWAPQVDAVLHAQRLVRPHSTINSSWEKLPIGTMICDEMHAFLITQNKLLMWSPDGYFDCEPPTNTRLLTPPATVRAFEEGFKPVLHESATPR